MDKYVCKGTCGGSSEVEGTCKDEACPNFGQPLELEKKECSDCEGNESKEEGGCSCCGGK